MQRFLQSLSNFAYQRNYQSDMGTVGEGGWCEGPDHAALYSLYRPSPPEALIARIVTYVGDGVRVNDEVETVALDVGCGPGQSTLPLADHFDRVIGIDVSKSQIEAANRIAYKRSNVSFKLVDAGQFPVDDESCDLVLAVQACHWFDLNGFYRETKRALKTNGTVAIAGYTLPKIEFMDRPELSELLMEPYLKVYSETANSWRPERKLVDNEYADFHFPFAHSVYVRGAEALKNYSCDTVTTLDGVRGYLKSWSGFRTHFRERGGSAAGEARLDQMVEEYDWIRCPKMARNCGATRQELVSASLVLRVPYFFRMGRKQDQF
ncbi:unnamed protein product [Notodromas monacha]|uniref:Methyltransferase type 11 domain-containing protein n=1 Tax=Notodromas monacha TaxID=399045 RepID=A0A7R9GIX4_9CRUS|nr:unnamed protein product [Notodromas monacha]CAG0923047.1 unnamed protein product [Notodromas monacha]